ncbi:MAG: diaminopimelate epimerase [Acidobacteria bacterium]|nr:diaminopimelate epimerase [Acidobacteriota bacterium]MBU4306486.1 diaminopimelate epimerase [Acidobacteriota bacterium]MBU4404325.1 diaminopimelate epimerase [Acidobacteriota bacterium]MBU4408634.1 diaminopimelate epimerase [Pseudomonadota bacterium]MCG2812429.1 diaminopimelate epimerase [Candidatus Aminicenantes bacterium]
MIFYKTSSFGNDFIEIDARDLPVGAADKGALAERICDRQRGVGADGAVFYRVEKQGFHFEIFNRDGGAAELSGNGMAGLAAVLFQRRLAASPLRLLTAVGSRRIDLLARRGPVFQLDVEIGRPDFSQRRFFPFLKDGQESSTCAGLKFFPVSVGNPHAVVLCRDRFAPGRLAALGKKLECHPMFPGRVNVEFVNFSSAEKCRVFFYERGVGATLASSTGSAAVFAVLRRQGKVRDRLAIDCGAEKIAVSWKQGIFVHNFTRLICRGNYFG